MKHNAVILNHIDLETNGQRLEREVRGTFDIKRERKETKQ